MSKTRIHIINPLILLCIILSAFSVPLDVIAPRAVKRPKVFNEHGQSRVDNYHWLQNSKNPNVLSLLVQENKYADKVLAPIMDFSYKLYYEMAERFQENNEDIPVKNGDYWYYQRFKEGEQYPLVCRKKIDWSGKEKVIFDQSEMAKGLNFFILKEYTISNDNDKVAYVYDTIGNKQYTLRIKDLKKNKLLPDVITQVAAKGFVWTKDDKAFYYLKNDDRKKSYRLMKHVIGEDISKDEILYEEKDKQNFLYISQSNSKKYLILNSKNYNHSETHYLELENGNSVLKPFEKRSDNVFYTVEHYEGNEFFVFTNYNAFNYQLLKTSISNTRKEAWKTVIAHKPMALLVNYTVLKNHLVTHHKEKGIDNITIHSKLDTFSRNLTFSEQNFEVSVSSFDKYAYNSDSIRINYSSLTVQNTVISYDLNTGKITYLKQDKVNNYYSKDYESKRLWVKSRDSVMIPVSIVYKKSLFKQDATNPLIVYGYGAYGDNTPISFQPNLVSLLDRGFVYAIAHVRGGSEMGNEWYENGKLKNKMNTFNDFIDCAHYLRDNKYGNSKKLFAFGGSAGGTVIGNVINQEPELFKGVIATVPWMDVLNDMMDESLPLTVAEYTEWGNPNVPEYYDYIKSWSPYDNIRPANYPHIYTTGNLYDQNVPFSSPAKWVQKVRDMSTSKNPVIFKCNLKEGGHQGPSGRYTALKNISTQYAFLLNLADIHK
jgi:oligopeptidase B